MDTLRVQLGENVWSDNVYTIRRFLQRKRMLDSKGDDESYMKWRTLTFPQRNFVQCLSKFALIMPQKFRKMWYNNGRELSCSFHMAASRGAGTCTLYPPGMRDVAHFS